MATRGANGRSTIFKRQDGRWHGYVSMGTRADGRRDRRHVSAFSRATVVGKVRALEATRDRGVASVAGRSTTVGEWLGYWVENIAPLRVRPRTLDSYRSVIRVHLLPRIGKRRLDQLRPEQVEQVYTEMLERGLSAATVIKTHRVLHRALTIAVHRDRVVRNVADLVEPPAQKRPVTPEPLSVEEARRVMAVAQGRRNAARWTVALALGLRQSEALALQWRDVDLDVGRLSVHRGLHQVPGGGLVFQEPKNVRSRRTLALPRPLVHSLRQQLETQHLERIVAGSEWRDDDLVFAQANGKPIQRSSDYAAWCALLDDAGVRHIRLHDARHTAATLLLADGVQPWVVMDLLGHSQMPTAWARSSGVRHRPRSRPPRSGQCPTDPVPVAGTTRI